MLLGRLGIKCSDEIILQRITPLLIHALDDSASFVRITALRSLRTVLTAVKTFSSFESNIFPQFIFPAISRLAKDPEITVKITFVESIVRFAETAKRFLERAHLMAQNKVVASDPSSNEATTTTADDVNGIVFVDFSYDKKLKALHEQVSRWIRELVVDVGVLDPRRGSGLASNGSIIKRTLLVDLMRLCVFFGQESTMEMLLPQLLTFLNDQVTDKYISLYHHSL
jgi:phosphoinositide-3-kinase regulatory subunit 4